MGAYYYGDVRRLIAEDGKVVEDVVIAKNILLYRNFFHVMETADTKFPLYNRTDALDLIAANYSYMDYFDYDSLVPVQKEEAKNVLKKMKTKNRRK